MRGSCLCGEVAYEAARLASRIQHCSCKTCRKAHAAAFNTATQVKRADFKWTRGESALRSYESSPGKLRYFCGNCGTQLIADRAEWDTVILRVATLDEDPHQVPELHIWASHEVPWLRYGNDVVAYEEWEVGPSTSDA